jgi:peroxiredoxin-like protein
MAKKQTFESRLAWQQGKIGAAQIDGRPVIEIAIPAEFGGPEGYWSPEDLFLASINSCLMTTFLYFTERSRIPFESYESAIRGNVELVAGQFTFTSITVAPKITIADESARYKVETVLNRSKNYCLISAAVKIPISVEADIVVGTGHQG